MNKHGVIIEPVIGELGRYYTWSPTNDREPYNKYITECKNGVWHCGCSDFITRCIPNRKRLKRAEPYQIDGKNNPNRGECKHCDALKEFLAERTKHLNDY